MKAHLFGHIRRKLIQGLFLVLPLLITLWLLTILFDLINENVTPHVRELLTWAGIPGLERWIARLGIPIIGLLLTAGFIYLLGLIAGNIAGRRGVMMIESYILRIPLVRGIYGPARQLLDSFNISGKRAFSKVVLLEYPRRRLWTVGFVTADDEHNLAGREGGVDRSLPVFLPTTPNPTSGWMILVPTSEMYLLDMTVEDGIKLVVSGGIVSPGDLGSLVREWPSGN
jgi:uncharacterized membrane protein